MNCGLSALGVSDSAEERLYLTALGILNKNLYYVYSYHNGEAVLIYEDEFLTEGIPNGGLELSWDFRITTGINGIKYFDVISYQGLPVRSDGYFYTARNGVWETVMNYGRHGVPWGEMNYELNGEPVSETEYNSAISALSSAGTYNVRINAGAVADTLSILARSISESKPSPTEETNPGESEYIYTPPPTESGFAAAPGSIMTRGDAAIVLLRVFNKVW